MPDTYDISQKCDYEAVAAIQQEVQKMRERCADLVRRVGGFDHPSLERAEDELDDALLSLGNADEKLCEALNHPKGTDEYLHGTWRQAFRRVG